MIAFYPGVRATSDLRVVLSLDRRNTAAQFSINSFNGSPFEILINQSWRNQGEPENEVELIAISFSFVHGIASWYEKGIGTWWSSAAATRLSRYMMFRVILLNHCLLSLGSGQHNFIESLCNLSDTSCRDTTEHSAIMRNANKFHLRANSIRQECGSINGMAHMSPATSRFQYKINTETKPALWAWPESGRKPLMAQKAFTNMSVMEAKKIQNFARSKSISRALISGICCFNMWCLTSTIQCCKLRSVWFVSRGWSCNVI